MPSQDLMIDEGNRQENMQPGAKLALGSSGHSNFPTLADMSEGLEESAAVFKTGDN